MKIKKGFKMRNVMGTSVIVAEGADQINFNKLISLNESAALMWHAAEAGEFTADAMAQVLVDEYGIGYEQALADSGEVLKQWIEIGLVEQ